MKIQYMSDLHMELYDSSQYIKHLALSPIGDVLVLAGDTASLRDKTMPNRNFWSMLSKNYKQVLLEPGNYEYYGNGDVLRQGGDSWERRVRDNVKYYQNRVVRIEDTDFILSTLWSNIPPQDEFFVSRGINDFRQIMHDGRRFTTANFVAEHQKCIAFIKQAVEQSRADKIVVVTHHLPTFAVIDPRFKGDVLNSAFATELGNWIATTRINAWIFGHSHANIDTVIGNTRIVCNQMGYVAYGEHTSGFNPNKFIKI